MPTLFDKLFIISWIMGVSSLIMVVVMLFLMNLSEQEREQGFSWLGFFVITGVLSLILMVFSVVARLIAG